MEIHDVMFDIANLSENYTIPGANGGEQVQPRPFEVSIMPQLSVCVNYLAIMT